MSAKTAKLQIDGIDKVIELPIYEGTTGPDVLDVRGLVSEGVFTYDPGFVSTASCESEITFIDGGKGVLLHRGYPIEQLAEKATFLETCFLLLDGELPTPEQKTAFENTIRYHTMVDEHIHQFFKGFPKNAHPMAMLVGVVGALSAFYHDDLDIDDPTHRKLAAHRLIAKMPTLAAMCYKHSVGQPFMYPQNSMGFAENFLHMMFGTPCEEPNVSPTLARLWTQFFCFTLIMSRMHRHRLSALRALAAPILMRASRQALRLYGGPLTAAPTRLSSKCFMKSAMNRISKNTLRRQKTRTIRSD